MEYSVGTVMGGTMKKRRTVFVISAFLIILILGGCGKHAVSTGTIGVIHDEEFGGVYTELSIEEFDALGFSFGDSIDIEFDNGLKFKDIPYYSGYYCPIGELEACGYPGYPHVMIARCFGEPTWEEFGLTDLSKVKIMLHEKGKYLATQEASHIQYSDEREDYSSDQIFANFRELKGGNIREKAFYRSASPCDNSHCRAKYADLFAEEYGIHFVLNLADNDDKYGSYQKAPEFGSAYYDTLYDSGEVLLLSMDANYRSEKFTRTISEALYDMTFHDGPCLVHCLEGKDRTGFVCALVLALAGASYDEIADDYMITFDNYYGITKESDPVKYKAIKEKADDFYYCMCDAERGTDPAGLDLKKGAEDYLRKGGLSDIEIKKIEEYITNGF